DGEERGPDFFESRDTEVPYRTRLFDPQHDKRVTQVRHTEPAAPEVILPPGVGHPDPRLAFLQKDDPKKEPDKKEPDKKEPPKGTLEIRPPRQNVNVDVLPALGGVIVQTNNKEDLEEILKLIEELVRVSKETQHTIFILPLEQGDATSIVNTMNILLARVGI